MAYTPTNNPYIPGDPYSYDLKWIVTQIKAALSSIEGLTTGQSDLSSDFDALREYVYTYFDNLDISQEVEDKINELYAAGFFDNIIEEWMNGHIKWTNPNLLDNPWFTAGNLINTRAITDGQIPTGNTYLFDRWKSGYFVERGIINISSGFLTLDNRGNANTFFLEQVIPPGIRSQLEGRTVTASAILEDGTIVSGSGTYSATTTQTITIIPEKGSLQLRNIGTFRVSCSVDSVLSVKAVKLELGPYSTLANDAPPNYAEELKKCQYYLIDFGNEFEFIGRANTASIATFIIPWDHRTGSPNPTIGGTYTAVVRSTVNASGATPTAITLNWYAKGLVRIQCTGLSGLTAGQPVFLAITSGRMLLSADL